MSKYISLLMLFVFALFFVGCGERGDFTEKNVLVYEQGPRENLIVVSVEDIPRTDLSRIVVINEKNSYDAKFSLITSKSRKLNKGDKVAVVEVHYYRNSNGLAETFWTLGE